MERDKVPAETLKQMRATLLHHLPDAIALYRFGSWGTVYQRPDSDIDLAVLPSVRLAPLQRWELGQALARVLYRDVDLVDLRAASTVLRAQVIAYGERLYCGDPFACETFENYVFASYARLNEERGAILRDIRQRGQVYAR
jgi:predicted nucleotidyltransferase